MSFEHRGRMPLDYDLVDYPGSVLRFRGPKADFDQPFVVCIGGAETFGRFIHAPFPMQLDQKLPVQVVNMGVVSAGMDVIMTDPAIRNAMERANQIVLQVPSATNMTNRFYSVHSRRNDRFLMASSMLRTIYRDVDFTEFHFTRHLLAHLKSLSEDRFAILRHEIQAAWQARMSRFLAGMGKPVHLLWIANHAPPEEGGRGGIGAEPLLVTRELIDTVVGGAASVTIATDKHGAPGPSTRGMFFAEREAAAARALPGPRAHDIAAEALLPILGAPNDQ